MPKRKRASDLFTKFGFTKYKRSDGAAVATQATIDAGRNEREDAARLKDKEERAAHAAAKMAAKRRPGRPRKIVVLTQPADGSAGPSQAATGPPPSTPMQGLADRKRGKYTNWYQPHLSDEILSTVDRVGSVDGAVRHLKLHMPTLFSKLSSSTIRGWFMPQQLGGKRYAVLRPGTRTSLLQGCKHSSGGRPTVMAQVCNMPYGSPSLSNTSLES